MTLLDCLVAVGSRPTPWSLRSGRITLRHAPDGPDYQGYEATIAPKEDPAHPAGVISEGVIMTNRQTYLGVTLEGVLWWLAVESQLSESLTGADWTIVSEAENSAIE